MEFFNEANYVLTVCDENFDIIYMNEKSAKTVEKWGGMSLIGKSLMNCHNEKSKAMMIQMKADLKPNSYTIEKTQTAADGSSQKVKKFIYQSPWLKDGKFAGLVEYSFEIPFEMPHFIRS